MRSVALQKAYDFAATLSLQDYNGLVQIIHEDGTTFFIHHATVRKWNEWYIIFPEHHDTLIYHENEVKIYFYKNRDLIEEIK